MASSTIDLSTLAKPTILLPISFEDEVSGMLADLIAIDPVFTALVESDPIYKVIEVFAARMVLVKQQFNDRAVAGMLAYANLSDLDNLAVTYGSGVYRLGTPAVLTVGASAAGMVLTAVISAGQSANDGNSFQIALLAPTAPNQTLSISVTGDQIIVSLATDGSSVVNSSAASVIAALNGNTAAAALVTASPLTDGSGVMAAQPLVFLAGGVNESDSAFRNRIHLAPNGFSSAGPKNAYKYFALSVAGVGDISVQGPNDDGAIAAGTVVICVMGSAGDGTLADPNTATAGEGGESLVLAAVRAALNADDVRPLNDTVVVRAASAVTFSITASLTLFSGPDSLTVLANAQAAVATYVTAQHAIGADVTRAGLISALFQPGVQNVSLSAPGSDVTVTDYQFSSCTGTTVTIGGYV